MSINDMTAAKIKDISRSWLVRRNAWQAEFYPQESSSLIVPTDKAAPGHHKRAADEFAKIMNAEAAHLLAALPDMTDDEFQAFAELLPHVGKVREDRK